MSTEGTDAPALPPAAKKTRAPARQATRLDLRTAGDALRIDPAESTVAANL
jgi:hypothetical protein